MKICKTCGVEKPLDEYHRNKNYLDGRVKECKDCRNTKLKAQKELRGKVSQLEMYEDEWVVEETEKVLTILGYELYNPDNTVYKQFKTRLAKKGKYIND
jgi:superfamily II helicase